MLQRRISKIGLAKQSAKGAAATAATYAAGVTDGSILKVDPTENDLALTWSNRTVQGHDRVAVKPGMTYGLVATPSLIGLLLYAALGADAVTGAGPYTHVLTPAADLPYLTGFGTLDTTQFSKVVDCKVNTLELSWDLAGALKAKVDMPGLTPSFLGVAYTETNQELIASVGYLDAAGGTFNVEGAAAQITGGSVKIDNHLDQIVLSAAVTPNEVFPGQRDITYSLKIVPQDMALFREVVFGASTAGALSGVATSPYYGAVDLKWLSGANSVEITSPHCKFAVAFPDSNPAGGPAEVTLEAVVTQPTSGADTTATVINSVATY